ncbi:MAG: exodeoxyribonuclease VII small subunit [Acidimicrobiales bacterium]
MTPPPDDQTTRLAEPVDAEPGTVPSEGAPDPGYGAAIEELESILTELEGRDVDVDVLAERVARGAELVRVCRRHLRAARVEVDAVIEELLDEATDGISR